MKSNALRLLMGIWMIGFMAACSRPVAYFQPTARESFASKPAAAAPVVTTETTPVVAATPNEQVAQAAAALNEVEAVVRNDAALSADKTVQKRLNRVRSMLASASAKSTVAPNAPATPKKMNLVERMMLKKMDRKINRQLAPNHPDKTMVSTGILATGAVVVIVGLVLLLATSASTAGVILLLAGAVILLVGLL